METMGNPTAWALENAIAELEGGYHCSTYPSGLAAISVALMAFLKSGDHLLMTDKPLCSNPEILRHSFAALRSRNNIL